MFRHKVLVPLDDTAYVMCYAFTTYSVREDLIPVQMHSCCSISLDKYEQMNTGQMESTWKLLDEALLSYLWN